MSNQCRVIRAAGLEARSAPLIALAAVLSLRACVPGVASAAAPSQGTPPGAQSRPAVTVHSGTFGGEPVRYTAVAKSVVLHDSQRSPVASIFSVAYLETRAPADRPVMFVFNGGPGTSSAYLHLGALGPMRVEFPSDLDVDPRPPYRLVANRWSPLDLTDIVFIDPPETGYSRALPGDKSNDYASIAGDARLIAQFIRSWLEENGRTRSPKYILGESYGATRAALVADILGKPGAAAPAIRFNGIVLLGQMLTVDDLGQRPMNAQGFAVRLPSMAAVAWYYRRAGDRRLGFQAFLESARSFALTAYLPALMLGHDLAADRRAAIADRLSAMTGLPADVLVRNDLRVTTEDFRRELIPGRTLGDYDARYSAMGPSSAANGGSEIPNQDGTDPAWTRTDPIVSGTIARYLHDDLEVRSGEPYRTNNHALSEVWSFGSKFRAPASSWLMDVTAHSPNVFVLIASGYDDLVTPFTAARYLVSQLPLKRGHGWFRAYTGGHQFYTDADSLGKFSNDLHGFLRASMNSK